MKFGKVVGQVIATQKTGKVAGLKLLVVQPLDEKLVAAGQAIACIDTVQAKSGDLVLLCGSSSARLTELTQGVCVDMTIVGMVDSVSQRNERAGGAGKRRSK
jgi:ethanolamine utilization protein EutN